MILNDIILVNKPTGITSFDAIQKARKELGIKKIGHAGTLDKFACGLLIVLTGSYTRLTPYFSDLDKEYIAEIEFGKTTATLDPEGEVVETSPVPEYETIIRSLRFFTGKMAQIPPLYSAIHHHGQRAYKLALRGETPDLKARDIILYSIDVISYQAPCLTIRIKCSKGTYVRSLARDIGKAAGSCAYVKNLQRTMVGAFLISEAAEIGSLNSRENSVDWISRITSIPQITVKTEYKKHLLNGKPLSLDFFKETRIEQGISFVLDDTNQLVAVIKNEDDRMIYQLVIGKSGN